MFGVYSSMLMLINKSPRYLTDIDNDLPYGILLTPSQAIQSDDLDGLVYGMDNEAFTNFQPDKYLKMLETYKNLDPKFVTLPDVVGDHEATLKRWYEWLPEFESYNYKKCFVCQNGMKPKDIPNQADSLFIGGDDEFKFGKEAQDIIDEGKDRGMWVHIGRVNSMRRIRWAVTTGADSFDGSQYARYIKQKAIPHLELLKSLLSGNLF